MAAIGVFYAGLPAVAMIWLRSDVAFGLLAVVFLIIVIIAADTAAFLSGRSVRRTQAVAARSPRTRPGPG